MYVAVNPNPLSSVRESKINYGMYYICLSSVVEGTHPTRRPRRMNTWREHSEIAS